MSNQSSKQYSAILPAYFFVIYIILFLTNSAAYAVQGYGLALRYLLKPLSIDKLAEGHWESNDFALC